LTGHVTDFRQVSVVVIDLRAKKSMLIGVSTVFWTTYITGDSFIIRNWAKPATQESWACEGSKGQWVRLKICADIRQIWVKSNLQQ